MKKLLIFLYILKNDRVVGINPLTWVYLLLVFPIGMLGAIWDYVVEFYKETKDVKWYNTGFSKTWLYTVYDVTAAYIQFVLLHKWNPYTEEMFEITDKINFTGIRKRLYNKIKKVNGCL